MARGLVIEAKLERGRGPVVSVLVQSGTLKVGDAFVLGTSSGESAWLLERHRGPRCTQTGRPFRWKLSACPEFPSRSDPFVIVIRSSVWLRDCRRRAQKQRAHRMAGSAKVSLDDLFAKIREATSKSYPSSITGRCAAGSAEALPRVEKMPAGP